MVGDSRTADSSKFESFDRSFDEIFDVLSHHHRRYVLACLLEHGEPVALTDLAEAVASHEHGTASKEITDEAVTAIETALHHLHIPKLVGADIVEYDPEQTMIRLAEGAEQIERYMSLPASEG